MAEAGKHIWIEKPVGLSAADASAVADAVAKAGVQGAVGFNYRNAPAVGSGPRPDRLRRARHRHAHPRPPLQPTTRPHPDGALTWRYELERGGQGVLGDLASNGADLARYLLGDIASLTADTAVFLPERARPTGTTAGHSLATGGELGPGRERGLRQLPAALRLRRPGCPGGLPGLGRRAEQLRLRGARYQGRGVLGLPPG